MSALLVGLLHFLSHTFNVFGASASSGVEKVVRVVYRQVVLVPSLHAQVATVMLQLCAHIIVT